MRILMYIPGRRNVQNIRRGFQGKRDAKKPIVDIEIAISVTRLHPIHIHITLHLNT